MTDPEPIQQVIEQDEWRIDNGLQPSQNYARLYRAALAENERLKRKLDLYMAIIPANVVHEIDKYDAALDATGQEAELESVENRADG